MDAPAELTRRSRAEEVPGGEAAVGDHCGVKTVLFVFL